MTANEATVKELEMVTRIAQVAHGIYNQPGVREKLTEMLEAARNTPHEEEHSGQKS